jgi:hypothetical protein
MKKNSPRPNTKAEIVAQLRRVLIAVREVEQLAGIMLDALDPPRFISAWTRPAGLIDKRKRRR